MSGSASLPSALPLTPLQSEFMDRFAQAIIDTRAFLNPQFGRAPSVASIAGDLAQVFHGTEDHTAAAPQVGTTVQRDVTMLFLNLIPPIATQIIGTK
jgi:hypothetical protein